MELDQTDRLIIEFLQKDSRVSFRNIAKKTGLSTDTVMRRYRQLEKEKVIQPTIKVNLLKLGYESIASFGIMIASQNMRRKITEKVAEILDVNAVMETTGEYDLMVLCAIRNVTHAFKIGEDISKITGVRRITLRSFHVASSQDGLIFPPPFWNNLDLG
jgi:DNA-binding Lrp family transcriptional regulator